MAADPSDAVAVVQDSTLQDSSIDAGGPSAVCATCHRPLIRPSGETTCARCLASLVFQDDDEPSEAEPPGDGAAPGQTRRYGHFEVLTHPDGSACELGHGAMGTTYRAQDTVLRRAVALKVIGRNVAEHPAARTRFLREARAAAQLQHPNVATVSHYGEQDGECFYAMELVEGETLAERVRRDGPLPVELALEITIQATLALVAAETRGIVHRDLKPTNLMLVAGQREGDRDGSPFVKVIDFGLAKAITAAANEEGVTETRGGFVGTPAFASPEQFDLSGESRIDHRADIYSLGVTTWYALCGRAPFVGCGLEEIHARQTNPLPLEQLTARGVPPAVITLLKSMLAVDPADRPPSARGLLEDLRRCQDKLPLAPSPARRRRRVQGAAAAVLCVTIAAAIVWWTPHPTAGQPGDRSLAVLPFANLSPKPEDAFFTTGVQDEITADLARIGDLKVISPSSTKKYLPGQRDLAAIGRELGVAHLLAGSARREDGRMDIQLRLVDLRDPEHPWSREYRRPLADVFAVQGEIARAVADQLQVSLSPAEKATLNRPPTRDLAAYDLFLRTEDGPGIFPGVDGVRRHKEQNIALLDQAVALDPDFTRAYCALAMAHDYIWWHRPKATPDNPPVDHRALAESALQRARTLEPDSGDVHLALADHLMNIHDSAQAGVEADLACRLLPNNARAAYIAGIVAMQSSRADKAAHCLERAVALDPFSALNHWMLACVYGYQRRGDDSVREYGKLIPLAPADEKQEFVFDRAMCPLESRADLAPLRAFIADLSNANDPDGSDRFKAGLILKLCEHDADGASRLLAASGQNEFAEGAFVYPKEWFQAQVALLRKDPAAAHTAFAGARAVLEKRVAANPEGGWGLSYLAVIDAGLGRKEDAVREALRACALCTYESQGVYAPIVQCNLAVVYAWTGQSDLAFAALDKAVGRSAGDCFVFQPTYGDLRLNPLWDALRADPRFEGLVRKLAPPKAP